ncbi:SMI1/KNR4 family protein [Listeria aquatica]|uniref:SMI1/KNR4 family protein n=1 Tax=Listeria aquatica TaxID=1494960 RepID=UPI0031F57E0B
MNKKKYIKKYLTRLDQYDEGTTISWNKLSEEELNAYSKALGKEIPKSYRWFLETFGESSLFGFGFEGKIEYSGYTIVDLNKEKVAELEPFLGEGLEKRYLFFIDESSYGYAFDYDRILIDNEPEVICWDWMGVYPEKKNFYSFLWDEIKNYFDNEEELAFLIDEADKEYFEWK